MIKEWYVEFSLDQNCFHIDTLSKIKSMNLNLCRRKINNGYVIIGGSFGTLKEAEAFTKKMDYLKIGSKYEVKGGESMLDEDNGGGE